MTLPQTADVVIVGAGPAGLAAAAELGRLGVGSIHVLDREPEAGGIPRHCGHSPYGMREFRRVMGGQSYAKRLTAAAQAAGAVIHTGVTVTALHPGGGVDVSTPDGVASLRARAVLLAMGVRETPRAARFIGGTKPGGVMNTGALQGLVYLSHVRPFRRPVILGTELVSFSALMTCRHARAQVAAMVEPGAQVIARWPAAMLPRMLGVPLHLNTTLAAIHGRDRVEGVTLTRGGATWDLNCDGVVVTGGFRPENALLRAGHLVVDPGTRGPQVDQFARCSDPAFFAAGNMLRPVETAGWCWDEGRRVAQSIEAGLAGALPDPALDQQVATADPTIGWTLPQRVSDGGPPPALDQMQIAVTGSVRGTLRYDGQSVQVAARPERRVLVPLPREGVDLRLEPSP